MSDDLKPTLKNALVSHCWECCGFYMDGKIDCENTRCQFYSWMPYAKKEPDLWWVKYNPRRTGKQLLSEQKKQPTSEKSKKALENYRKQKKEQVTNNNVNE